jgi:hypothetical protein
VNAVLDVKLLKDSSHVRLLCAEDNRTAPALNSLHRIVDPIEPASIVAIAKKAVAIRDLAALF